MALSEPVRMYTRGCRAKSKTRNRDGVWTVQAPQGLKTRLSNTDPPKSELLAHDVRAGFSEAVQAALLADSKLPAQIAISLLERHFPESIHPDILAAVGLSLAPETVADRKRDPLFRQKVLTAYEWRCAVCGFDVRLGSVSIALDAAHIRWHQAGGPAQESNGLALCVLHHKTFNLGAFTLNAQRVLLVSDQAVGTVAFEEMLLRHHGKAIRPAQRPEWAPDPTFVEWHQEQVFKGQARHLGEPA